MPHRFLQRSMPDFNRLHFTRGWSRALIITVIAFAFLSSGCGVSQEQDAAKPLPSSPEALLAELQDQKNRMDESSSRMHERIEEFNRSRPAGARTVQFSELFVQDLDADQRDVLDSLLAEEEDISYRSLLEKIINDRNSIRSLQARILHLEQNLPEQFVIVGRGDTHYALATDFLVGQTGISPERGSEILSQADLTDELLVGNKVWFFYDDGSGSFGTYVTQGEAGRTPLAVRRAVKRQLITERDAALVTAAELERARNAALDEIEELEIEEAILRSDVMQLRRNKADLENSVERISGQMAFYQNSLFYHAATVRELKDQGVISRVLKRVEDLRGVDFGEALDLRHSSTIRLTPQEFGLERITSVRILPPIFEEGRDFEIEVSPDFSSAKVVILNAGLFRGKEVLVAVGG